MKILILGPTNSRNAGGLFNCAHQLGKNLHQYSDADVQFLLTDDEYSAEDRKFYEPLPLHTYTVSLFKKLGYSRDMLPLLKTIQPDIIHTQGIWMYYSYINKKYHSTTNTPYIISPHGMLDPWQLKQSFLKNLKKKIVLSLYEKSHLKNANCIHALCEAERIAIREFGLKNAVAIIPNGTDLPVISKREEQNTTPYRWDTSNKRKTLLFLSRIHQKKGLDNLLKAWALTEPKKTNWQLVIAGETKDTNYVNVLTEIVQKLQIEDTVKFIGGQFGDNKQTCLMDADAFILPSFSEGLPLAVLEAWSFGIPVIMTKYCNIPEGFTSNAAIEIETDEQSIAEGINKMIALNDHERSTIGINGLELVKEKFTWEKVALSTMELYEWVSGKKDKPSFVTTN